MPVDVIDTIIPKNNAGFPVVADTNVEGGFQVQPTTVARDAIPALNRKAGMLVYVTADSTYYQLAGDLVTWNAAGIANNAGSFNVRQYGAVGDGFTNDRTAFVSAAAAAAAAGGGTVYVPPGVYVIATSLTLGATVDIQFGIGARVKPSSGQTFTVTAVIADSSQYIFDISANGLFVVTKPGLLGLSVIWFGAVGDGIASDASSIQATITSAQNVKGNVFLPPGTYLLEAPIVLPYTTTVGDRATGVSFLGAGMGSTFLVPKNANQAVIVTPSGQNCFFMDLGKFTVQAHASGSTGVAISLGSSTGGFYSNHVYDIECLPATYAGNNFTTFMSIGNGGGVYWNTFENIILWQESAPTTFILLTQGGLGHLFTPNGNTFIRIKIASNGGFPAAFTGLNLLESGATIVTDCTFEMPVKTTDSLIIPGPNSRITNCYIEVTPTGAGGSARPNAVLNFQNKNVDYIPYGGSFISNNLFYGGSGPAVVIPAWVSGWVFSSNMDSANTPSAFPTIWAANTAYTLSQPIFPITNNGFVYIATPTGDGLSGSVEPTFPTVRHATIVDHHVTWTCDLQGSWGGTYYQDNGQGNTLVTSPPAQNTTLVNYFNVKTFGAVGDDTADDTLAINAAITAAVPTRGTVYFPPGTYKITSQLTVPYTVGLKGVDYSSSILQFHGAINGILYEDAAFLESIALSIEDLAILGDRSDIGLVGLTVKQVSQAKVKRCGINGWTRQGVLFLDTILSEFSSCFVSGCGSTVGDGYAAVEVDHDEISGTGSTTWYWFNNNVTGNPSVAGLRIDRTSVVRVIGGTSEGSGVPIQISHKTSSTSGTTNVVIDGLDLEMNGTVADETRSFIEMGYGMSAPTGFNQVFNPVIQNCTMFASVYNIAYGIKCKYTHGIIIDGNIIEPGGLAGLGPATISNIWFEGNTCDKITIGNSNGGVGTVPYVMVNGAVVTGAVNNQTWSSTAVGIDNTIYSDLSIDTGTNLSTHGSDFTITPQAGTISAGNVTGGNLIVHVQAPQGIGNVAGLIVQTDGYDSVSIGQPAGFPNYGCIAFGVDNPGRGNAAMSGLGVGHPLYLGIGASDIEPQTGLSMGGYPLSVGLNLFITTAETAPSNPASGFVIYIDVADGKLKAKSAGGTVTILANP